jgi:4-hydroxy-3-methylbut-2-enyl diphosphate reductase
VTAGASAPEELVEAVIRLLAPRFGVEEVSITDEDEYFPPPREVRELLSALETAVHATLAVPSDARVVPLDREIAASEVLAALAD